MRKVTVQLSNKRTGKPLAPSTSQKRVSSATREVKTPSEPKK